MDHVNTLTAANYLATCTAGCVKMEVPEKVQDYIAACFDGCLYTNCIRELIERFEKERKK